MKILRSGGYVLVILIIVFSVLVSACAPKATVQPTEVNTATIAPSSTATKVSTATATFTPEPTATESNTPTPMFVYKLKGLNWGPYTNEGQSPNEGTIISQEQLATQLDTIAPYTEWVRTYGCQGLSEIVPMAHERGIKVAMGAWLGSDPAANEVEIACLIANATISKPEMVIVGSETLLRGDITADQLIGYLQRVRAALPEGVLITTADTANGFINNEELVSEVDTVLVNLYPYWAGVSVENSMSWLNSEYNKVVDSAQDKQVWVSETGWPSDGLAVNDALPSDNNTVAYFINFVSWAKYYKVNYFYFEAFDEPWKFTSDMPQEAYWGIWNLNGMKEGMQAVFDGETADDSWSPTSTPIPTEAPVVDVVPTVKISGPPEISIETYPQKGGFGEMTGTVRNVDYSKYIVACYIEVNGGWWVKPAWGSESATPISAYGDWSCYVTTGGIDDQATTLKAYLLPKDASVPQADGGGDPSLDYPSDIVSR